MSMLAEPRKKQKWTLNPKGKDWSNDTTKFGQKMLEKMGWSIGKGLGVNEQGITEHVKVKVKNDTIGIGFKDNQEAWTECQEAFNDFLMQLQETKDSCKTQEIQKENSTSSGQSLEFRSKQSRARVHYHKFTRGKDVQKYSSKDLATILGQKNIINEKDTIQEKLMKEQKQNITPSITETTSGIVTINSGNMNDYFKNKNPHLYKNFKDNTSEADSTCYTGFGFKSVSSDCTDSKLLKFENNYAFENPCLNLNSSNDTIISEKQFFKKRKEVLMSKNNKQVNESLENVPKKMKLDIASNKKHKEGFINIGLDLNNENNSDDIVNNKFEVPRDEVGLINDALDLSDENCSKKKVTFNNHVEYSVDSTKKPFIMTLDKFEVDSKKRKKKQKHDKENTEIISSDNAIITEVTEIKQICENNEINQHKDIKERKKKQCKISNLETIEETLEEDNEVSLEVQNNSIDIELNQKLCNDPKNLSKEKKFKKKRKKKDKRKIEALETEQVVVDENKTNKKHRKHKNVLAENITSTDIKEKRSKKDKIKKNNTNQRICEEIEYQNNAEDNTSEEVSKDTSIFMMNSDVLYEKDKKIHEPESISVLEKNEKFSGVETENSVAINESTVDSPLKKKSRITKKALKMFFNGNYVSPFPGANLDSIIGYGVQV